MKATPEAAKLQSIYDRLSNIETRTVLVLNKMEKSKVGTGELTTHAKFIQSQVDRLLVEIEVYKAIKSL